MLQSRRNVRDVQHRPLCPHAIKTTSLGGELTTLTQINFDLLSLKCCVMDAIIFDLTYCFRVITLEVIELSIVDRD